MKRVIIGGCRDFNDYSIAREFIADTLAQLAISENITIISGGCRGADKLGERYATENGLMLEIYKADWIRYKRAAGPIRNKEMVLVSDAVICFWDGQSKGTKSLAELARKNGKAVFIKKI